MTHAEPEARLAETWASPGSLPGWLSVVNNQPLGVRFMATAALFFLTGGVLALLMRVQLAVSDNDFVGPDVYNQLFTMHGSTMMFLFAVPFIEGLAVYLLPMMIGSRDVAYPRLTAFGFWTYLFGALLFYAGFAGGAVPDAGWFSYTPLSGPKYSGAGQDFWLVGLGLVEIGGITAGIEMVATILKLRAPGMAINRMPLFAWAMLVSGVMIVFAFSTLLIATVLLELDRSAGTHFFNPDRGGNSLLWQHLFWFFGHPEVYIMFLPATGVVSMIVGTFARRILGYTFIAVAVLLMGFLSFGLWVHHMFASGLPQLSMNFFSATSLMIGVASGLLVFAWIGSLWGRRPDLKTPLLFVLGFLLLFVLGGFTGIMVAIVPFDLQVHDTFFVVAHFHYVLIGGVVFPLMGGLHYWLPKVTGKLLDERMGLWSFWLTFIGFNLTFFPMHAMGFFGMPRRVYTYPRSLGLDGLNLVATAGAFVLAAGFLLVLANAIVSQRAGRNAGANPWGGGTLEWAVASPPPPYTYFRPPIASTRYPLWRSDETRPEPEDAALERLAEAMAGRPATWRATLVTDTLTGQPQGIQHLPGNSYVPLFLALGLLVVSVGVLARSYLVAFAGAVFSLGILIAWLKPDERVLAQLRDDSLERDTGLPVFAAGTRSTAWWGMVGFLAVAGTVFGALFYSYFYIRLFSDRWPQEDLPLPGFGWGAAAFALLVASALPQFLAAQSLGKGNRTGVLVGLGAAAAGAGGFMLLEWIELAALPFDARANAYGSAFWTTSISLWLLAAVGVAFNGAAFGRVKTDWGERRSIMPLSVELASLLGYFVAALGALVFAVLYVSPRVL